MNIRVCFGCPLRWEGLQRCPVASEKSRGVKGLGLTVIDFKCERKAALFKPGQPVSFDVYAEDYCGNLSPRTLSGWVMGWKGRKVRVVSEQTIKPILHFYPKDLRLLPGEKRACIHCGMPEGVQVKIREMGEPRKWTCRAHWDGQDFNPSSCEYPRVEGA